MSARRRWLPKHRRVPPRSRRKPNGKSLQRAASATPSPPKLTSCATRSPRSSATRRRRSAWSDRQGRDVMATRARINLPSGNTGTALVRWESLAEGDVGDVIAFSLHRRASVQVEGTFGAGGSLVLEGSNDSGDNWQPLSDVQ